MVKLPELTVLATELPVIVPCRGAGNDCDLSRTAGGFTSNAVGNIDEELADAGPFQKRTKQDKQKDKRRTYPKRRTYDTLCRVVQVRDDTLQTVTSVPNNRVCNCRNRRTR